MGQDSIINETIDLIYSLPEKQVVEVRDFADFLLKKYENKTIVENIKGLISNSKAYDFIEEDEELYSISDLKINYNEKGEIVLIPFPFTELTQAKLRPAIVLIENEYGITVSFITSQLKSKNQLMLLFTLEN